jgi:hypothetical protein
MGKALKKDMRAVQGARRVDAGADRRKSLGRAGADLHEQVCERKFLSADLPDVVLRAARKRLDGHAGGADDGALVRKKASFS